MLQTDPLWVRDVAIEMPRANIFDLDPVALERARLEGARHAWQYPVTVTGLAIPHRPLDDFFEDAEDSPFRRYLLKIAGPVFPFRNFTELYTWLDLSPNVHAAASDPYFVPRPADAPADAHYGVSLVRTPVGQGLSFSCGSCHASEFFGKTVIGLPNKRPRANEIFRRAKKVLPLLPADTFRRFTHASDEEVAVFRRSQVRLQAIRPLSPLSLGLDTSLAHVGRSLAARRADEWASFSNTAELFPRKHELDDFRADSKPMPWWNVKYKNRWLSDGSVVSGNPVLTNILWNEIGRGTDLRELEEWVHENTDVVEDLTARVFSTRAPRFTDFFPPQRIELASAKRGEALFRESCAGCHGNYEKAWNLPGAHELGPAEVLATTRVRYHRLTPVKDVGTESNRHRGMAQLAAQLNSLSLSRRWGVKVEPQIGYVPPPLEGIFARYPYFHNASVPNLCALLEVGEKRPRSFVQGPARNIATDYDFECGGYPTGAKIPAAWRQDKEALVDTNVDGRRAMGHDRMLKGPDGREKFSPQAKRDLIEFLKTL